MSQLIKPPRLCVGDTVALVSPSGGLASLVPHRTERAKKFLESKGFKVVLSPNSLERTDYTAGTPEQRVSDIHWAFANPEVKAIVSMIWGFHSNQLVNLIDYELVRKNPKIFVGFSDMSVLHFAFHTKAGLVTFYGPAALTQFGEPFGTDDYTWQYFERAVMSDRPIGKILASDAWTDEMLNWFSKADLERPRTKKTNNGFRWLRSGRAGGKIVWGCITSILHLRGTEYWPDFKESLFFWEIPESSADIAKGEPVSRVDAHLQDLRLSGVFDQINGMIVGRPKGYSDDDWKKFHEVILKNVADFDFPILADVDVGHTDPIITLPLGVGGIMDSSENLFAITETAVL